MTLLDFDDLTPHTVQEVVCLKCLHRWYAVYPQQTLLKDLQCPNCEKQGFVIATGQEMEETE